MRRRARHTGSIYLPVLGAAMMVTIIGLSAMWITRIQRYHGQGQIDYVQAQLYARSGIEAGLLEIATNTNWRSAASSTWASNRAIGGGTFSLTATDPDDSDLADSDYDSVVLLATGYKGDAVHKMQVTVDAVATPLELLKYAIHVGDVFKVKAGDTLTLDGGAGSTNNEFIIDGVLDGDVEADDKSGNGTITGTLTVPIPDKQMPDSGIFAMYRSMAVTITPSSWTMEKFVLGPNVNPWGTVSPEGIYYINTNGNDLTIRKARISGTLVIDTGGKTVKIHDPVFIEPADSQYPVLVINGDLEINIRSSENSLDEDDWNTNFNPSTLPYNGVSDWDTSDEYPNEIRGLVHVLDDLLLKGSSLIRGAIIATDDVEVDGNISIIYDPSLYSNPPIGYANMSMEIAQGGWKRVVN